MVKETPVSYGQITLLGPLFDKIPDVRIVRILLALVIILIEAALWNTIINRQSLLKQSTYFPLFFFLLFSSCRPSMFTFYPSLVASFFLILSISRLINSYQKDHAYSEIFDGSLFIGIAVLFYLPCLAFFIFLWASIIVLRTINWRDWTVSVIGFLLPFLFTFTYNKLFYPEYGWFSKIATQFTYHKIGLSFSWQQIIVVVTILITAFVSLWFFSNKVSDNILKTQKSWILMLWFCVAATLAFMLSPVKDAHTLFILSIPGSLILSAYFIKTKSRLLPEFLFVALIGAMVVSLFL